MNKHSSRRRVPAAPQQSVGVRRNRRSWLKTVLLGVSAVSVLGYWRRSAHAQRVHSIHDHSVFPCAPGKWGNLQCERMVMEPRENVLDPTHFQRPPSWFFKGYSRQQLQQTLRDAGVGEKALTSINDAQFSDQTDGVLFKPSTDFIVELTPEARQKIYGLLMPDADASRYFDVFAFAPHYLEITLQETGLPSESLRLFRSLLYKRGNLMAFSDVSLVLATLPDGKAKTAFLKMIVRRPALSVKLKLDQASNLHELADYWGWQGRTSEVQSILDNAAGSQAGGVEITELLTPFVRKRANTFPTSENALELVQNCHWTSLNFFNQAPTDRFLYIEEVEQELTANYGPITSAPQLGDLVLFRNTSRAIVHSASFIADNIVFTKNGEGPSQPWCFMNVTDVTDLYTCLMGPISVKVYRRNVA